MSLQREGSRHPDSTQRNVCGAYVNRVRGEQVSIHNSSSSHRRQLAALFFTMLSLELLVMSNGAKVLCWEPQHCVHSEEHILGTQRCYSMETPLMLCFSLFVFSVLLFLSSSRKQCTCERDVQKREMYSCGADWCAHLAVVFCTTT